MPKTIGSYSQVWKGKADETSGGLKKNDIKCITQADGKHRYVSKVKSEKSIENKWMTAVKIAREQLGIKEFISLKKDSPLYLRAKEIYDIMPRSLTVSNKQLEHVLDNDMVEQKSDNIRVKKTSVKKRSVRKNSVKKGSVKKGSVKKGSVKKGNVRKGSVKKKQIKKVNDVTNITEVPIKSDYLSMTRERDSYERDDHERERDIHDGEYERNREYERSRDHDSRHDDGARRDQERKKHKDSDSEYFSESD
jgi:hypothetical protein